jgi:hypothetical protein
LSILGRRGSNESGWTWSRPPSGPRRVLSVPPLLPLAGVGLIALFVALALLGAWLWGTEDDAPAGVSATPTPTPAVTATPSPTPTPTPTPIPTPTPTPSLSPVPTPSGEGPLFRLAAWDGQRWQFEPPQEGATYGEGEGVPFVLRIDRAGRGAAYPLTIRYDCDAFAFLTSYGRDHGNVPALASGGPESAAADTTLSIPDDPGTGADDAETGSLSLWGGSFTDVGGLLPSSPCTGEKSLTVGLAAAADTLHLMWAAEISPGAAERDAPLRLVVKAQDTEELGIEIDPESVRSAQP